MNEISNLINYYKDCYQADTRTLSISNIYSQKVENRIFIEGSDQLLNGDLPYYPVENDYAEEVSKNLSLYKREKEFYTAAFSIIGQRDDVLRKQSKVCAPLFLYPSKIINENDIYYVQINFQKRIINTNFLNSIKMEGVDDLYEVILEEVPSKLNDFGTIGKIKRILESKIENFDAEDILHYPQLFEEKKLKRSLSPSKLTELNGYRLVPAISFCVLRRSNSTQGIISEMNLMAKEQNYSSPIHHLFGSDVNAKAVKLSKGIVPAILSQSQNDVIQRINKFRTTLLIGPPGTGKSFTIAALALDFMSKGKSVLIASKTDQAVDVIHKKIEKDLGIPGVAFRAGRSDYKRQLKAQLQNLLTNTRKRQQNNLHDVNFLKTKIKSLGNELEELEKKFGKLVSREIEWGEYVSEKWGSTNFFEKLKIKYIKWRNGLQVPHWDLTRKFMLLQQEYIKLSREYSVTNFQSNVHIELYKNRSMFRDFLKSVTARTSSRQDLLFEKINLINLLKTFPIWLVNMADIFDIFPLRKGIFDLAIIDEATQCDIASCLPIFQRAKRIIVVGDPKQLRHASFLSGSVQKTLQKKNNLNSIDLDYLLDYRNMSILDLVDEKINNQEQVCFLDEHYRSKPDIIGFSNRNFYASSLRIMTSIPYKDNIQNQYIIEAKGKRDRNGVNKEEAKLIMQEIKHHIEVNSKIENNLCQTIGILSPFRDQADYIGNLISDSINLNDIEKYEIRCGTAYSFQGEERDIMLISLAIDQDSHHSAIIHLNKPDVFNVSITRARSKQIIYKSFPDSFNCGDYLSKFLDDIRNFQNENVFAENPHKDQLLEEVKKKLIELKLEFWSSYSVVGIDIDLVFKRYDKFYGIDLIGYPGEYEDALSIEEHKILARAGIPVFPLPFTYWKFDENCCFEELMKFSEN